MNKNEHHPHKLMEIPPIFLADVISKIIITPDTDPQFIAELEKGGLKTRTAQSPKVWAPNPHMDAYNRRRAKKKLERKLAAL